MTQGIRDQDKLLQDAEIRFADGRRYWAATDSLSDFILHPIFLKYAAVCVLIYGLLDRGGADTGGLHGFEIVVLWVTLGCVAIGWYALFFVLVRALMRRGLIRVIYTPVATLSLFIVTTSLTYLIVTAFKGHIELSVGQWSQEIIRDMLVILLMDIVFSQFVAPFHPFLLQQPPSQTATQPVPAKNILQADTQAHSAEPVTAVAELSEDGVSEAEPDDMKVAPHTPAGTVAPLLVGSEVFAVEDLIYIRSEDHYLRIVTARRRVLARGKLADAVAQLDFRLGIQINRSTWIAFDAISDVQDDKKGVTVVSLQNGDTERVALSRRIAFLTALQQHGGGAGQATTRQPG